MQQDAGLKARNNPAQRIALGYGNHHYLRAESPTYTDNFDKFVMKIILLPFAGRKLDGNIFQSQRDALGWVVVGFQPASSRLINFAYKK